MTDSSAFEGDTGEGQAAPALRIGLSFLLVLGLLILNAWFFAAMCVMAGAMVVTGFSGTWRDWWTWVAMLLGFALFASLRAAMEGSVEARPLYVYVIRLETLGGVIPAATIWLQGRVQDSFLNPGGLLDVICTATYISFFIVPQLVVVYLWKTHGPFHRYVAAACLLFAGALAVHFFLPTAPPWMAAERGLLPPIHRIGMDVLTSTSSILTRGGYAAQANDVAAMPSVHQGLAVLAMLALGNHASRARVPAWIYALLMLFSITYLGEHYAVDGIVGAAMAWGAWRLTAGSSASSREPTFAEDEPPRTRPEKSG